MNPSTSPHTAEHHAPRMPLPILGLACAVGVSTIYYNQPLLLEMARTFHTSEAQVGYVAVATQVGYAAGLLGFVPLGDVLERRGLMLKMYAAVAISLLLMAAAPNLPCLIVTSILAGMLASVTHIALPIAPDLADEAERGKAIGTVMTGLLLGVLLARTFSGWVSRVPVPFAGWRFVFIIAAVLNAAFVPILARLMPPLPPRHQLTYPAAIRSLWDLVRTQPLLRESSLMGALVFASFSCFWTTLAFMLQSRYGLGPGVAGTFGVVGAAGAAVAPIAGRLSDTKSSRWVVGAGVSVLAVGWTAQWLQDKPHWSLWMHLLAMGLGTVIMDVGMQLTQVGNQVRVFSLMPGARSRLNTVYMTIYFAGGAVGSAMATFAWAHWGWGGVCIQGLLLLGLALLRHATGNPDAPHKAAPLNGERAVEV